MTTTKFDSGSPTKYSANRNHQNKVSECRGRVNKDDRHHAKKMSLRVRGAKKSPLEPIQKIEWPEHLCEMCGEPITDLTQALSAKSTGKPVHFECVLGFLKNSEELKEKEEVVYIGHGNFAVVYFENPKIRRKFKIVKLIEWEDREKVYEWRDEVTKLGSST